ARGDRVVNYDIRPHSGPMAWLLGAERLAQVAYEEGTAEDWPSLLAAIRRHNVTKLAHLASPIDTDYLNRHPKVAFDVMITGAVNALEATRVMGLERFVFFSSIAVLPTRQYEPIDANHPLLLASEGTSTGAYGAGKLAGEALCWAYQKSCGVDFVILRPSAAYGFTTRNLIYLPQFVEGALRGEPVHFDHGGTVPRDYTHVEDIAGTAAAALAAPPSRLRHRCFYAGSGAALVTAEQSAEIVRELIPSADISIRPELNDYDRLEIPMRGLLDMQPVAEQLDYRVRYPVLRDGVAQHIRRYGEYLRSLGQTPAPTKGMSTNPKISQSDGLKLAGHRVHGASAQSSQS
ncbi:MAG: NAD-dependent epimerase/dehydratase family protein, partial [Opitutaceae bacterium]